MEKSIWHLLKKRETKRECVYIMVFMYFVFANSPACYIVMPKSAFEKLSQSFADVHMQSNEKFELLDHILSQLKSNKAKLCRLVSVLML